MLMLGKRALKWAGLAVGVALAWASAAAAQTDYLWPRFGVDLGAYDISTTDEIRIDGEIELIGRPIDLSADIGLPDSKTLLSGKLDWAFAERHSLEFGYWSLDRSGSRALAREIEIGGYVFPIGAEATVELETTTLAAAYTYWFVRHDNFGVGGNLGLVYLGIDAKASATVELLEEDTTVTRDASANTDLPVPVIGFSVKGRPWERLVLYARGSFLPSVTVGDYSGEAGVYSLGADFYFWGPLAVGASFDGSYYNADVEANDWNGSVDIATDGFRFYLRAAF